MKRDPQVREETWKRAAEYAPFLQRAGRRHEPLVDQFIAEGADAALNAALAFDGESVAQRLRRRREGLALVVALADLAGDWGLEQVTRTLSDFADSAIDRALAAAIEERVPGAPLEGMTAIALGKLGSRELNYSSDVDLILLYDPDRLPRREGREAGDTAVRIARDFVAMLQERTADGYVARVDLRLRPASEATPIALPVSAAIGHYESAALPWERAAFIRARVAGGDRLLGQRFLDAVQPFVWRRAIDFGVIDEIRGIAHQVRDHYAEGRAFGPGFDLKRGRGGIRELEFFVQSHQMIYGGRDPQLRIGTTLDAIEALRQAGHFDDERARLLGDAYRTLRTAEHRLQMVEDRQTHSIPREDEAIDNVARLAGAKDGADWLSGLEPHVETVAVPFDELVADDTDRLPADRDALAASLDKLGLVDPASAARLIHGWRTGKARSLRSPPARAAFEAMLPTMIEAIGAAPDQGQAFNRFADIVEKVPSAINFYRLLEANPDLARLLATILAHSPTLAAQLARRPALLDGLLDRSAFDPPRSAEAFAERLRGVIADQEYDVALDRARALINEKRFALGVQLIDGKSDPLDVAKGYAGVAEGAIRALADATREEFELTHGRFDGDGLVILGLGRLGGEALTHASDLDVVFIYDAPFGAQSDGARPLTPANYYNRLANRIVAALSVPTAAGPLYEVDTRLRPQGLEGALAVSFDAFHAYQRGHAWTWEHMALMRARPVYGRPAGRQRTAEQLADIFGMDRDPEGVRRDARIMRADMATHKPPRGPLDLKLGPGGLVDLEFAVHVTQLVHREGLSPRLGEAIARLVDADLAPTTLPDDHALLTRMLLLLRLVSPDSEIPAPRTRGLLAERLGFETWEDLLAAHDAARERIEHYWETIRDAG